uniref:CSON009848 protein n=1 Tax=Culicoides sonorensis TaxID=179676 RepID=A0A336M0T9_CULSO
MFFHSIILEETKKFTWNIIIVNAFHYIRNAVQDRSEIYYFYYNIGIEQDRRTHEVSTISSTFVNNNCKVTPNIQQINLNDFIYLRFNKKQKTKKCFKQSEMFGQTVSGATNITTTTNHTATGTNNNKNPISTTTDSAYSAITGSIQDDSNMNKNDIAESRVGLTQAGLEEYSRSYYDTNTMYNHQKQSSYAQSEGYHSYVSSLDSSSTPFLDRLRQDSELMHSRNLSWSQDYVSIAGSSNLGDNSPESSSSTETLKWLGSMSDLSVISHATSNSAISEIGAQNNTSPSQLVVHSSRVRTPQRHNSESVLFMKDESMAAVPTTLANSSLGSGPASNTVSTSCLDAILDETMRHQTQSTGFSRSSDRSSRRNNSRLFAISTYTETPNNNINNNNGNNNNNNATTGSQTQLDQIKSPPSPAWQSVAERINEIEKNSSANVTQPTAPVQQSQQSQKYTFLDPAKTQLVSNPALKALQKNAVQSYFERQQSVRESITRSKSVNQSIAYSKPVYARPHSLNMGGASVSMKNLQRSSMSGMMESSDMSGLMQHSQPLTSSNYTKISPISPVKSPINESYDPRYVIKRIASKIVSESENQKNEVPPTPPPRNRAPIPVRRTSSAAEYSSIRDKINQSKQNLSKDLLGPIIMGPIISLDDWVPERPPKNPTLRIPSPDLPPPPVINVEQEVSTFNQDEPLPPPPEEVLRHHVRQHSEIDTKQAQSPSRRNSFAGHSSRIVKNPYYESANLAPVSQQQPLKRSNGFDHRASHHNFTSHHHNSTKGTVQAHRVVLSHENENNMKISMRKRAHNMQNTVGLPMPPSTAPPPPLKPRMSAKNMQAPQIQERSTSKATYLPRQTHDKHQLSDPDHGSYKLKLTSNEDCINHDSNHEQLQHRLPNKCNNLPDVLPLAVKYNNNNNNNNGHQRYFSPPSSKQKAVPQSAPIISTNNLKSLFNFAKLQNAQLTISDEMTKIPPVSSPPSSPGDIISLSKYTSQSVFDLQNTNDYIGHIRDDPPPYTDEIKKELVQHLEFSQPIEHLVPTGTSALPVIKAPSLEKVVETSFESVVNESTCSMSESPNKTLSDQSEPPSYEETQQSQSPKSNKSFDSDSIHQKSPEPTNQQETSSDSPLGPTTSETACQTEECSDLSTSVSTLKNDSVNSVKEKEPIPALTYAIRRISPEEVDCDNLSKDLVSQLSPLDKLHSILVPPKTFRQTSDYVAELFNIHVSSRPLTKKDASTATEISSDRTADEPKTNGIGNSSSTNVPASSTTYTETLEIETTIASNNHGKVTQTHYSREMTLISSDSSDLTKKKEELVERLGKKLQVLSNEQMTLTEESLANDLLGEEVLQKVTDKVKPSEASRYRSYVDDVGYITKLLLSLSGRLAKTHNSLQNIEENNPEKKSLESKRDRLVSQLEEAKNLKENIDKRGNNIAKILEKALTIEEYADYDYFIHMKAKLLVDSAEIGNKIKLGIIFVNKH